MDRPVSKIARAGLLMVLAGNGLAITLIFTLPRSRSSAWVEWFYGISIAAGLGAGILGLILATVGIFRIRSSQGHLLGKAAAQVAVGIESALIIYVAIMIFTPFHHGISSSEAKMNLGAIFTAYAQYYNDYGVYPSAPEIRRGNTVYNCFSIADWKPRGQTRFAYECANRVVYPNLVGEPIINCPVVTRANRDSFTIAACGNIDQDEVLDVWTMNDSKTLENVIPDRRVDSWDQIIPRDDYKYESWAQVYDHRTFWQKLKDWF